MSVVIDAGPTAGGVEQFLEAEPLEILGPGFRLVEIALQISADAGLAVAMAEQRLVKAVAFVRRRAERDFDDRVDREKRDLSVIGMAADLIIRDDPLSRQDHP